MPTNQQRREAERRRLQRQLEQRRAREASRKRLTMIASIVGTIIVVVGVVLAVVLTGGSGKKATAGGDTVTKAPSASPSATPTPTTSAPAAPAPTAPCAAPSGATTKFDGLTVAGATDLKHEPKLSGALTTNPKSIVCQDLVVGKGAVAKTNASATVQYVGAVAKTGKVFQASWTTKQPATFPLAEGQVIQGFLDGIAGAGKVAPMHVGGRRIVVLPADAAYGANPPSGSGIPANAALVFIVDLTKIA